MRGVLRRLPDLHAYVPGEWYVLALDRLVQCAHAAGLRRARPWMDYPVSARPDGQR